LSKDLSEGEVGGGPPEYQIEVKEAKFHSPLVQVTMAGKSTSLNGSWNRSYDCDSEDGLTKHRSSTSHHMPSPDSTPKLIGTLEGTPGDIMTHCDTKGLRDEQTSRSTQVEEKPWNSRELCGTDVFRTAIDKNLTQTVMQPVLAGAAPFLLPGPYLQQMPPMMPPGTFVQIEGKQDTTQQASSACAGKFAASNQGPAPRAIRRPRRKKVGRHVQQTSVILRNLPLDMTRDMFLYLLYTEGFAGTYDLIYLPRDFRTSANLGYAFVNLLENSEALRMQEHFTGFSRWSLPSSKRCEAAWSSQQGLAAYIDRYRNNPVMHEIVPDEFKPVLFQNGVRVAFPRPTQTLKMPQE